jgi:hypothetical protein
MRLLYFAMHLTLAAAWLTVGALFGVPWWAAAIFAGVIALVLEGEIYKLARALAGRRHRGSSVRQWRGPHRSSGWAMVQLS